MTGYHYEGTGHEDLSGRPADTAQRRCAPLVWAEQVRFMDEYDHARAAELAHQDTYGHWRAIQDDATLIAGYLEGLAAARRVSS